MSVTVIKEGNMLRLIDASEAIPDGKMLVLYTAEELRTESKGLTAWEAAQIESVFSEDDEDWGNSLDHLVVKNPL